MQEMSTVLYILSREYLSVTLKKEKKLLKLVNLLTFLTQLRLYGCGKSNQSANFQNSVC